MAKKSGNTTLMRISSILDCDEDGAREFCREVQRQFKGVIPPFNAIADALNRCTEVDRKAEAVGLYLKENGWEKRKKKQSIRKTIKKAGKYKRRHRYYFLDECGTIVSQVTLSEIAKQSKRKKVDFGPIKPKVPISRNDTFTRLRQEFEAQKALEANEIRNSRKSKGGKKRELVYCPECPAKVRISRIKKHLARVHNMNVSDGFVRSLPKVGRSSSTKSSKVDRKKRNVKVTSEEKFKQADDDTRYGGKYVGWYRRESGKFGSLPMNEDHDETSDAD